MSYKIVFFDIDGTLVDEQKQIPASTREAIGKLKERGVKVAIATGRSPFHLMPIAQTLEIDSFVSYNGSYVMHQGKLLFDRPIVKAHLQALEECAARHNHPMVFLSDTDAYANHDLHPQIVKSFGELRVDVPGYHPHYWREANIYQAMLYCLEHEEERYADFTDFTFVRWHQYSLDVVPKGGSKARGIAVILEHLGLHPSEAVAFGDGLNDREMLSYVGAGIAMGNAHEGVKPYADFITRHVRDDGVFHGLRQLNLI